MPWNHSSLGWDKALAVCDEVPGDQNSQHKTPTAQEVDGDKNKDPETTPDQPKTSENNWESTESNPNSLNLKDPGPTGFGPDTTVRPKNTPPLDPTRTSRSISLDFGAHECHRGQHGWSGTPGLRQAEAQAPVGGPPEHPYGTRAHQQGAPSSWMLNDRIPSDNLSKGRGSAVTSDTAWAEAAMGGSGTRRFWRATAVRVAQADGELANRWDITNRCSAAAAPCRQNPNPGKR